MQQKAFGRPAGELTALPQAPSWIYREGKGWEGKGEEGRGKGKGKEGKGDGGEKERERKGKREDIDGNEKFLF